MRLAPVRSDRCVDRQLKQEAGGERQRTPTAPVMPDLLLVMLVVQGTTEMNSGRSGVCCSTGTNLELGIYKTKYYCINELLNSAFFLLQTQNFKY